MWLQRNGLEFLVTVHIETASKLQGDSLPIVFPFVFPILIPPHNPDHIQTLTFSLSLFVYNLDQVTHCFETFCPFGIVFIEGVDVGIGSHGFPFSRSRCQNMQAST